MMGKTCLFRSEKPEENVRNILTFSPSDTYDARYPHQASAHFTSLCKNYPQKSLYTKPQKGLIPLSTASYSSSYSYL